MITLKLSEKQLDDLYDELLSSADLRVQKTGTVQHTFDAQERLSRRSWYSLQGQHAIPNDYEKVHLTNCMIFQITISSIDFRLT
jgi:hypothetical protein